MGYNGEITIQNFNPYNVISNVLYQEVGKIHFKNQSYAKALDYYKASLELLNKNEIGTKVGILSNMS